MERTGRPEEAALGWKLAMDDTHMDHRKLTAVCPYAQKAVCLIIWLPWTSCLHCTVCSNTMNLFYKETFRMCKWSKYKIMALNFVSEISLFKFSLYLVLVYSPVCFSYTLIAVYNSYFTISLKTILFHDADAWSSLIISVSGLYDNVQ